MSFSIYMSRGPAIEVRVLFLRKRNEVFCSYVFLEELSKICGEVSFVQSRPFNLWGKQSDKLCLYLHANVKKVGTAMIKRSAISKMFSWSVFSVCLKYILQREQYVWSLSIDA